MNRFTADVEVICGNHVHQRENCESWMVKVVECVKKPGTIHEIDVENNTYERSCQCDPEMNKTCRLGG